jgi:hypothetical protein
MKIKWGALVVDGSGKLGGHVASKNRSGSALRTKVTPSNPQTSYQANVRSRLTSISQAWAGLTDSERQQWNSAAVNFAGSNIFGDKVNPSGFNLYQKLNNNLSLIGAAAITAPPSPAAVGSMESLSVTAVNATGVVTITYAPAIDADTTMLIFATAAENAGKSFVKNKFRLIGHIATADASPYVATAMYNAKFGAVGAVGKKIHIRVVGVNENTGQQGIAAQATAVIS